MTSWEWDGIPMGSPQMETTSPQTSAETKHRPSTELVPQDRGIFVQLVLGGAIRKGPKSVRKAEKSGIYIKFQSYFHHVSINFHQLPSWFQQFPSCVHHVSINFRHVSINFQQFPSCFHQFPSCFHQFPSCFQQCPSISIRFRTDFHQLHHVSINFHHVSIRLPSTSINFHMVFHKLGYWATVPM